MGELTVLYDERCALCARLTTRVRSVESVLVEPIGSERGAELLADLPPAERYASVHVVDGEGRRRSGSEALPPLLRRVRGGGLFAWLVERFPRAAAWGYELVSRHREGLARVLRLDQARAVSRR